MSSLELQSHIRTAESTWSRDNGRAVRSLLVAVYTLKVEVSLAWIVSVHDANSLGRMSTSLNTAYDTCFLLNVGNLSSVDADKLPPIFADWRIQKVLFAIY